MITVINSPLINTVCPDNMNESGCPLRAFMKKQNVFHQTISNAVFELNKPYFEIRKEYIKTLDEMHRCCDRCKRQR